MTMEVETLVAVSLMMAVFSAVAAVGTSIVLGAGFERLRTGFEVVRKQTGFFSDAIHKLEQKVDTVDKQTDKFSKSMTTLEAKVTNVGDQANAFTQSMQKLEKKVDVVDKQTGFFSTAINKLEKQVESVSAHEEIVAEKVRKSADSDLISTGKAEALVSHAENLLDQVSNLATQMHKREHKQVATHNEERRLHIPRNLSPHIFEAQEEGDDIRFH